MLILQYILPVQTQNYCQNIKLKLLFKAKKSYSYMQLLLLSQDQSYFSLPYIT